MAEFRYHPDPIATGSAVEDARPCELCGVARGVRYEGPIYSQEAEVEVLCLQCIASGRAAAELLDEGGTPDFTGLDESDEWDDVPDEVKDEVLHRTPGYFGWQQEQWRAHCQDAAAFLGPAGTAELEVAGPGALEAVRDHLEKEAELDPHEIDELVTGLSRDGEPTAYVFRCLHCEVFLAYVDMS